MFLKDLRKTLRYYVIATVIIVPISVTVALIYGEEIAIKATPFITIPIALAVLYYERKNI